MCAKAQDTLAVCTLEDALNDTRPEVPLTDCAILRSRKEDLAAVVRVGVQLQTVNDARMRVRCTSRLQRRKAERIVSKAGLQEAVGLVQELIVGFGRLGVGKDRRR